MSNKGPLRHSTPGSESVSAKDSRQKLEHHTAKMKYPRCGPISKPFTDRMGDYTEKINQSINQSMHEIDPISCINVTGVISAALGTWKRLGGERVSGEAGEALDLPKYVCAA